MTARLAYAREYRETGVSEDHAATVQRHDARTIERRKTAVVERLLIVEGDGSGEWIGLLARAAFPHNALVVARSLREARAALRQHPCDFVLVDLQLPDGSGIQLIEEAARLLPPPRCIVITLLDSDEHIFGSLAAGAKGYLLKDQPRPVLVDQLRQLANGVPALSVPITHRLVEHFSKAPTTARRDGDLLNLSRRERDVLCLLARGERISGMAATLHISAHTVCTHIKNIYRKLGVSSRAQAALQAQKIGLV